jgi:hypothetical protein
MSIVQMMKQGTRRRARTPEYDFHLRHRAFTIQPFLFAPVRPGETLKNIMWQSRAVSDPLANPLMGWHLEYYFFYVQLQDAVPVGQEDVWLKPLWDPTALFTTSWGTEPTRLELGSVVVPENPDVTYKLYQRIIEEYFREEGEVWNSAHKMSGALALARRNRKDLFESAGSSFAPTIDVSINIADSNLTVNEITQAMTQYAMLMDTSMGAVTTFEDYLASQGQGSFSDVKRAYRPELIRVIKEWSYPTNTVDPITGTPTSALSWSISGRADKDRYFREPGYVIGLTVARPKTLKRLNSSYSNQFRNWSDWLPAQAMHDPNAGSATFTRDLLEYGFQFVNFDVASNTYKANQIDFAGVDGTVGGSGIYPVESTINSNIWKTATSNNVRQDGKLQMNVLTDLPPDMNVGTAGAPEVVASEAASIGELANEYVAKLKERREGKNVNLPNIRATLEKLLPNLAPSS